MAFTCSVISYESQSRNSYTYTGVQYANGKDYHSAVYPLYLTKIEKKGRTKEELHQVICWLTGFDEHTLQKHINEEITFADFFAQSSINPNAEMIKGMICGYRIEEIENPLTKQILYLNTLMAELQKEKAMEKILRVE